jgi:glutathione S-transferase
MLTLYTSPGACSLAPHIILEGSGLAYRAVHVDLRAKTIDDGSDYLAINPKGAVPAVEVAPGEVLTENAVVLQYLADKSGSTAFLPNAGLERYRTLEWVNFVATELHKGIGAMFNPAMTDEWKAVQLKLVDKKLDFVASALGSQDFLTGPSFRICDAYLFAILRWTDMFGIDLGRWPALRDYRARVAALPFVAAVLEREGLTG